MSSPWLGNTVATAIARLPGCSSRRAGSSTTNGSSGSGNGRGSRSLTNNPSAVGSGWPIGSCIRLRPEHRNHVWSYDFVEDRTHDGRRYRMLNVIDEFTHECLAIRVGRKLKT